MKRKRKEEAGPARFELTTLRLTALELLTNNLPEREFSEENQQAAMNRERQLLFFIQEIIVSYEGEVCGEESSFPIAHAGAETPVP